MTPWHVIQRYAAMPFEYGTSDCCQFVADYIESVTGENPADAFRYYGEGGAESILRQYGGLQGLLRAVLGEPSPSVDKHGVALTSWQGKAIAGVVYKGRLVIRTESGVTDWPIERAEYVWSL